MIERIPALHLHRSNRVEELGGVLVRWLRERPLSDAFEPETILVGSLGLRDWVRTRLTDELGIAANLRFVYDGALGDWLHRAGQGRETASNPWVLDRVTWTVARELDAWRTGDDRLAAYVRTIDPAPPAAPHISGALYRLAGEVASLLLRYVAWRPEMVHGWSAGDDRLTRRDGQLVAFEGEYADLAWQPELWRRVRRGIGAGASDPIALLSPSAQTRIGADGAPDALSASLREVLPSRLILFGVSPRSPLQLRTLARIAEVTEVHWFLTAPTPLWLGDQTLRQAAIDLTDRQRRLAHLPTDDAARDSVRGTYLSAPAERAQRLPDAHTPAGELDFDVVEGNVCPLIASFGRIPRANQLLLEDVLPTARDGVAAYVHPIAAALPDADPAQLPSLLHRLQADVYMLESNAYDAASAQAGPFRHDLDDAASIVSRRGARDVAPDDRSLGFHTCYGATRQVHTVRDLLVDALERDPSLRPGDIAVMTPDIARFAPLIEATFADHAPRTDSRARTGIPGLPIRIQDRSIRSTNPVAEVLILLLQLPDTRRTVSDVMQLLGLTPVHRAFGIARDELATVEGWLRAAGARWGTDATADDGVARLRLRHTLRAAIDRIALGTFLPLDATTPDGDATTWVHIDADPTTRRFPLDEIDDADLAARAVLFFEVLLFALEQLDGPRTLTEWIALFVHEDARSPGLLQRFVQLPASQAWKIAQVVDAMAELERDAHALGLVRGPDDDDDDDDDGAASVQVAPEAMAAWMEARLDQTDQRVADGIDAVTFCSLMPVRSVPYRWVVLLGVDAEIFPRQGTRPAWDLVARERRPWDRNPRDEDRALFLDALLSARDACHIVYSGRDPRTDAEIAPAPPVAQLAEMLDRRFDPPVDEAAGQPAAPTVSAWLTSTYPLQDFSDRNFLDAPLPHAPRPPVRHAGAWRAARRLVAARRERRDGWCLPLPWQGAPPPLPAKVAVTLDELVAFHEDPLAAWLRRTASTTWPRRPEDEPEDLLPTATGILARLDLLHRLRADGVAWSDELLDALPSLPIGPDGRHLGGLYAERIATLNHALHTRFEPIRTRELTLTLPVELAGQPVEVTLRGSVAWAPRRDEDGASVVVVQHSTPRNKHAMRGWLQLLLAHAAGTGAAWNLDEVAFLVASHKPKVSEPKYEPVYHTHLRLLEWVTPDVEPSEWVRQQLAAFLATWLQGMQRPAPVAPRAASKALGAATKKASEELAPAELHRHLTSILLLPNHRDLDDPSWRDARNEAFGDSYGTFANTLRGKLRHAWKPDDDPNKSFGPPPEDPLTLRVFGDRGPHERWPDACEMWTARVMGPGEVLAHALSDNAEALEPPDTDAAGEAE